MNAKRLLLFTSLSALCISPMLAGGYIAIKDSGFASQSKTHTVNIKESNAYAVQRQKTTINLDSSNLSVPHLLNISASPRTQLTGKISVDGDLVKQLQGSEVSFDLSPYLSRGRQTIEIAGTYQPESSSVRVKLSSPHTQVTQQMSGSGVFRQTLVIDVR